MDNTRQLRIITIVGILFFIIIGVFIYIAYSNANKNEYGESLSINNYDQKVKNLSKQYKDAITASLYKTVLLNSSNEVKASSIKDAIIRENSDSQDEVIKNEQYTGDFIVDIASIKQSYKVQYTYSKTVDNEVLSGYPILVSCLDVKDLKYGDFKCKDLYVDKSKQDDVIVGYLPYNTLDYRLTGNTTTGELVINAKLNITPGDLKGSVESRQKIVAMYKKEVTNWIKSKNLDPSKYTIVYNYDDNGNLLSY